MRTKFKKYLLTTIFLLGLITCIQAQDKYDVARIRSYVNLGGNVDGIYVTISGKETEFIKVEKKKLNAVVFDYEPIVDYIQKMMNEGWEVLSVSPEDLGEVFYLRKRK